MLRIMNAASPDARRALARIRGRLELAARELPPGAAAASRRAFGKALAPREAVARIIADVRAKGDSALVRYTELFDGARLTPARLRVGRAELAAARRELNFETRSALLAAARRIEIYQRAVALPRSTEMRKSGERLGLRVVPLRRVGIYIPGGTAAYPSSVLMNAIPAQVAGVEEIVLATPPARDGSVNPTVLAAAAELGITEVWRVGGAQAVAALAYGTKTLRPVDKIAGPGNLYVTIAKQLVYGQVDLDMPAGPSEVCVVADASARPAEVAADLLSQAEHDRLASCVLVTDSRRLAAAVGREVRRQLALLPRRETAIAAVRNWGLALIVKSMAEAADVANTVAPEHLELLCRGPERVLDRVRAAGTVFIGRYAPEPVGDYLAGPSHTLPTAGAARVFSGLSAASFCRQMATVELDEGIFRKLAPMAAHLARVEGLEAHARSVEARGR
ncbi:MAG TPA: histidinol dehydrogenase [Planctomycetota bacterium]|nr:histidinol dehydrogenase [Planctomycetota bacterium]